jgi:hypothetical protein
MKDSIVGNNQRINPTWVGDKNIVPRHILQNSHFVPGCCIIINPDNAMGLRQPGSACPVKACQ